ncbi:hypothetical protein RYH73_01110 [Olivibacter sp. CPCC 100613]|uniref:hypothetical protein n=1 Tax=Olivibacter sp. CPCC 100613 TaxID=3079931 RepID=UPI002FF9A712
MSSSDQNEQAKRPNTISLEKAKLQTKRWRELLEEDFPGYKLKNKAAFIQAEDLIGLVELFKKEKDLIGVRAYFALEREEQDDKTPLHHVKLVLVPVKEGGKNGKDVIEEQDPLDVTKTQSVIYDFTMPCPDCCDVTSPLFS